IAAFEFEPFHPDEFYEIISNEADEDFYEARVFISAFYDHLLIGAFQNRVELRGYIDYEYLMQQFLVIVRQFFLRVGIEQHFYVTALIMCTVFADLFGTWAECCDHGRHAELFADRS